MIITLKADYLAGQPICHKRRTTTVQCRVILEFLIFQSQIVVKVITKAINSKRDAPFVMYEEIVGATDTANSMIIKRTRKLVESHPRHVCLSFFLVDWCT